MFSFISLVMSCFSVLLVAFIAFIPPKGVCSSEFYMDFEEPIKVKIITNQVVRSKPVYSGSNKTAPSLFSTQVRFLTPVYSDDTPVYSSTSTIPPKGGSVYTEYVPARKKIRAPRVETPMYIHALYRKERPNVAFLPQLDVNRDLNGPMPSPKHTLPTGIIPLDIHTDIYTYTDTVYNVYTENTNKDNLFMLELVKRCDSVLSSLDSTLGSLKKE